MSGLSSHVLDTAVGAPARGLAVRLEVERTVPPPGTPAPGGESPSWQELTVAVTDEDGRVRDLLGGAVLGAGNYRLTFDTGAYFRASGRPVFYPRVEVIFTVTVASRGEHHHIPLLLSPFGYSTYRGT